MFFWTFKRTGTQKVLILKFKETEQEVFLEIKETGIQGFVIFKIFTNNQNQNIF